MGYWKYIYCLEGDNENEWLHSIEFYFFNFDKCEICFYVIVLLCKRNAKYGEDLNWVQQ